MASLRLCVENEAKDCVNLLVEFIALRECSLKLLLQNSTINLLLHCKWRYGSCQTRAAHVWSGGGTPRITSQRVNLMLNTALVLLLIWGLWNKKLAGLRFVLCGICKNCKNTDFKQFWSLRRAPRFGYSRFTSITARCISFGLFDQRCDLSSPIRHSRYYTCYTNQT